MADEQRDEMDCFNSVRGGETVDEPLWPQRVRIKLFITLL